MKKPSPRLPVGAEQAVLDELKVRLIRPEEQPRYDQLIEQEHYLHNAALVGEQLRHVAVDGQGRWLALLSWSAAAYRLRAREAWIGWTPWQQDQRRLLLAQNSRFLIRSAGRLPNLATRAMKLSLQRLSQDWQEAYGHPIVVVETFVDPALFSGTVYRAAGWEELGSTRGYRRCARDYYEAHDRPKRLFVRALRADSRRGLCACELPARWRAGSLRPPGGRGVPLDVLRSLHESLRAVRDRRRWHSHQQAGLLSLIAAAALCGVSRGQRDLAAFAQDCTQAQRRAMRCLRDPKTRRYQAPSESSFFRVSQRVEPREIEEVLLRWQEQVLGPLASDEPVVVDGKELCSSGGFESVSAYALQSRRWLGSEPVRRGSNEIPAARALARRLPFEGRPLLADALYTQQALARTVVQERGGEYVMTIKANQSSLLKTAQQQMTKPSFPLGLIARPPPMRSTAAVLNAACFGPARPLPKRWLFPSPPRSPNSADGVYRARKNRNRSIC